MSNPNRILTTLAIAVTALFLSACGDNGDTSISEKDIQQAQTAPATPVNTPEDNTPQKTQLNDQNGNTLTIDANFTPVANQNDIAVPDGEDLSFFSYDDKDEVGVYEVNQGKLKGSLKDFAQRLSNTLSQNKNITTPQVNDIKDNMFTYTFTQTTDGNQLNEACVAFLSTGEDKTLSTVCAYSPSVEDKKVLLQLITDGLVFADKK